MAYQPKFAKIPGKAPLPPVRQEKPKKKRSKAQWAALILLTILIVPASVMATAELLGRMYQNLGRPKLSEPSRTAGMAIGQQVNEQANQRRNRQQHRRQGQRGQRIDLQPLFPASDGEFPGKRRVVGRSGVHYRGLA